MIKNLLLLFSLMFVTFSCKQSKIVGNYKNSFHESLELKKDFTFVYQNGFDIERSWTKGKWTIKKDTIYLIKKIIYDTIQIKDTRNNIIDSIIKSNDTIAERLNKSQFKDYKLSLYGQDWISPENKLLKIDERIYWIRNNKVDSISRKNNWNKFHKPGFTKTTVYNTSYN